MSQEIPSRFEDSERPLIYGAMVAILGECSAIEKNRSGTGINYKFRGIDDIYNHLQSLLAKHGVFSVPEVLDEATVERTTGRGSVLIYRTLRIRYTFYAVDGSYVEATVIGEAMDSGDKAANKAMAVAHKYALIQAFNIRTADLDDGEGKKYELTQPPPAPTNRQPADAKVLQEYNKGRAAFSAIGIEENDMLMYVNKKTPQDLTEEDLNTLRNWYQERKGAKK